MCAHNKKPMPKQKQKNELKLLKMKDMWRMPSILDDPGKIIIMAGDWTSINNYSLVHS